MTQPEQSRKPRIAHQSTERMNELRAQQKSFALQNMRSKGLGNAAGFQTRLTPWRNAVTVSPTGLRLEAPALLRGRLAM